MSLGIITEEGIDELQILSLFERTFQNCFWYSRQLLDNLVLIVGLEMAEVVKNFYKLSRMMNTLSCIESIKKLRS
jgi:hypothetical protein